MKYAAYVCPNCQRGKVTPKLIDDAPGMHEYRWCCRHCFAEFGPPWIVRHHEPNEPGTLLMGPQPWPVQQEIECLVSTLEMLTRKQSPWRVLATTAAIILSLALALVWRVVLARLTSATTLI